MRIAIPVENGEIYQHFGHAPAFRVYDVENSKVIQVQEVPATGSGHAAMAGLLADLNVGTVICGGIGFGAVSALESMNLNLIAGASGNADEAVRGFLTGKLVNNPDAATEVRSKARDEDLPVILSGHRILIQFLQKSRKDERYETQTDAFRACGAAACRNCAAGTGNDPAAPSASRTARDGTGSRSGDAGLGQRDP